MMNVFHLMIIVSYNLSITTFAKEKIFTKRIYNFIRFTSLHTPIMYRPMKIVKLFKPRTILNHIQ